MPGPLDCCHLCGELLTDKLASAPVECPDHRVGETEITKVASDPDEVSSITPALYEQVIAAMDGVDFVR